jgi:hypothetical protein
VLVNGEAVDGSPFPLFFGGMVALDGVHNEQGAGQPGHSVPSVPTVQSVQVVSAAQLAPSISGVVSAAQLSGGGSAVQPSLVSDGRSSAPLQVHPFCSWHHTEECWSTS